MTDPFQTNASEPAKPRHVKKEAKRKFRFRYSRTTILLSVLLLIAVLVPTYYRAALQREAVNSFEGVGADFFYNFEVPQKFDQRFTESKDIYSFPKKGQSPFPDWILNLVGVDFCHTVVGCDVRAADVPRNLESIKALDRLKFLNVTNWSGPEFSLEDIAFLKDKSQLQALSLYGNNNLSQIQALANLRNLRYLNLSKTGVQDLGPLADLDLQVLRIHSVGLDDGQLDAYAQAHPNCVIERTR